MKGIAHIFLLLATASLLTAQAAPVRAQGNAAAAEALFVAGRADMDAGNFDAACQKFRQSEQLDPAVGTKFNLADCEEKRGNLATAWELFKAVEGRVPASDERHQIARQRREAVEPRVPKLKIVLAPGAPPNTKVRMGAVELTAAALAVPLPLDPGQHELVVTAPDHGERRFGVVLEEGRVQEVTVQPGDPVAAAPVAPAPAPAPAPPTPPPAPAGGPVLAPGNQPPVAADTAPSAGGDRTLGYVAGGVGAAGLLVGTVTGILAMGKAKTADDHCWDTPTKACDQEGVDANSSGKTLAAISTVGFAVGVVGVGLGTYLILTAGDEGQPETALVTRAGPTGGHVAWVRYW